MFQVPSTLTWIIQVKLIQKPSGFRLTQPMLGTGQATTSEGKVPDQQPESQAKVRYEAFITSIPLPIPSDNGGKLDLAGFPGASSF